MKKAFKLLFLIAFAYLILQGSMILVKGVLFPLKYTNYVAKYSREYNVNPMLVMSVMKAESNFDENAESRKNAKGLMQITNTTGNWIAEQLGEENFEPNMLLNPEISIKFACWYLNNLNEQFHDEGLVIAAYNAGRGNVEKWLSNHEYSSDGKNIDNIPFKETDKYVKKVEAYKNIYTALYK